MQTEIIVMTATAHVPAKARQFGRYRHVAVVEIDPTKLHPGFSQPTMIWEKAKGVVRIHWDSGPVNVGKTKKSAYHRALAEAEALVAKIKEDRSHV